MLGVVAAFAGVGLLPEPVKRLRLPILGGALVATWIVVFVLVEGLPRIFNPGPPVSEAVGGASFAGTPYRGAQFAAVAAMGLIAAAALAVAARIGTLVKAGAAKPESGEEPGVGRRSKIAIAGTALVCLSLAPDLRATLEDAVRPGATTWDTSNFVAWDFFANQGLVPMRDFFYPYGLQWLFDLFPQGPLVMWLARSATLAVIAWALWRLSGHSAPRVILSLLVVAAIGFGDDFLWRYMPAMALPLAYAAMGPASTGASPPVTPCSAPRRCSHCFSSRLPPVRNRGHRVVPAGRGVRGTGGARPARASRVPSRSTPCRWRPPSAWSSSAGSRWEPATRAPTSTWGSARSPRSPHPINSPRARWRSSRRAPRSTR